MNLMRSGQHLCIEPRIIRKYSSEYLDTACRMVQVGHIVRCTKNRS
jgi:hypothetical protein